MMLTVSSMTVSHLYQNLKIVKGVRNLKPPIYKRFGYVFDSRFSE